MHGLAEVYRFLALQLPIEPGAERRHATFQSIAQLTEHVTDFLDEMALERAVVCGNSLGGQVALDLYMQQPERVEALVLSGSAGLFERGLSGGKTWRVCREFIREQACQIFYDPVHVDGVLVDDVYSMLSDREYRRFMLKVAKATRDRFPLDKLAKVEVPTMVIWGRDDVITPPFVAEQFSSSIPNTKLLFIDRCGHAPPIERPAEFARHLHDFLADLPTRRNGLPCKPR